MAAQRGKDLLIKLDMGAGAFETIAGLRATRISFNAETVDVTNLDSAGRWRELLAGAGVRSAAISGSGVFRDEGTDEEQQTDETRRAHEHGSSIAVAGPPSTALPPAAGQAPGGVGVDLASAARPATAASSIVRGRLCQPHAADS